MLPKFEKGMVSDRKILRKCLRETAGYFCTKCGTAEWQHKELILIVNHKDGDAGNNLPINVELLCPNCDSQSEFFSGRNRGNGRKSRNLPRN
jgi:predicted nucleic-acid-binding Zn-ribbon protein